MRYGKNFLTQISVPKLSARSYDGDIASLACLFGSAHLVKA